MITRIEAYRYRCFKNLNVKMVPFQVMVGANGSGKTTLLDIPVLLGEMLNARSIETAFQKQTNSHQRPRTDFAGDLIYNKAGESFKLAIESEIPSQIVSSLIEKWSRDRSAKIVEKYRLEKERWPSTVRYEISFELFNGALQIQEENVLLLPKNDSMVQRGMSISVAEWAREQSSIYQVIPVLERSRGKSVIMTPEMEKMSLPNQSFKPTEPAFANLFSDASKFGAALSLRNLLMEGAIPYQPNIVSLRQAQPPVSIPELRSDGSTLPWLIKQLSETNSAAFNRWVQMVRLALPDVRSIEIGIREDDQHAYVIVQYKNDRRVPSSGLSDGTLSILAMTLLPYLRETRQLLTIEEPENGIHPKGIEVILESLRSIKTGQVWMSSHSPVVLGNCTPQEILCLALDEEGQVIAVPGNDHPALKEWKKTTDLGGLFASGVLG